MINNSEALNAAHLYRKALACHEEETVAHRFAVRVMALANNGLLPDDFNSEPAVAFLETITCGMPGREGESCAPNPYAAMACDEFLRSFRHMEITRSDWQPSQGLK